MRARRRDWLGEGANLDLLPVMNLISLLIPFLLTATQFVTTTSVAATAPTPGVASTEEVVPPRISISRKGFDLKLVGLEDRPGYSGGAIPCLTAGCADREAYDYETLAERLAWAKSQRPDTVDVILMPQPDVVYEVLIGTMDAARSMPTTGGRAGAAMFPVVSIVAGKP